MPNENQNEAPLQPQEPQEREEIAEAVKKPETPAERLKRRHEEALKESDDQRSARRAKELGTHIGVHMENVKGAHEKWPTGPATWMDPDDEDWRNHFSSKEEQVAEQQRWNEKRTNIDQANRAYHLAVKRSYGEHVAEDQHIVRSRAAAAKA